MIAYISNLRFAMRILLTEKQSTIRELNRSLRGKIRSKWIHYAANQVDRLGANGVVPLAANIVAPLSANELAPYWCQSTISPLSVLRMLFRDQKHNL